MPKTLIFTATDNKIDNVKNLLGKINKYCSDTDILVIDDNNPDGTEIFLNQKDIVFLWKRLYILKDLDLR